MEITVKIPPRRIADLMVTAIECNNMTRAWCGGLFLSGPYKEEDLITSEHVVWYDNPRLYEGDFELEVIEIVDEGEDFHDDDGEFIESNIKRHKVTQADFAEGFRLMSEKHGHHAGDFMNENEDAITADVFLQLVTLKEVVYG